MKKIASTALTAVLALSLVGCSSSSTASTFGSSSSASGDQTLKYGLSGIEGSFNPFISSTVYDNYVCSLVFEGLVTNDASGEYIPLLADWELSEDNLTYTFTLKDGIVFSDGNAMTADDVAFSYSIPSEDDYAGPRTSIAAAIANIDVIDEKTIAFTMADASPANLQYFTYGVLEASEYEHSSFEELTALNTTPVGSGKMVLDAYANKQYVNLVANENYWDADNAVQIEGVSMVEVSEDTLLSALQNGEIDLAMPAAKAENVEAIQGMDNVHLVSYLANGYTFMAFNTTEADGTLQYHPTSALSDVKVRQALLYALDRKSFLTLEYGSEELVSLGLAPISPISWAFPDEDELNPYDYDLDKAAALLDEAGWTLKDGDTYRTNDEGQTLELHWLVYTDATWPGTLSSMAVDSWGQIGVDLHVELMDFNTVAATVMDAEPGAKDFDIYTMGWSLSIDPDPTGGLFDGDAYSAGGYNATGFYDQESQDLMKAGLTEFDQDARADIYKQWAVRQNELVPTTVVAYRSEIWGISDRVHGLDDINAYQDWTYLISDVTLD